jgi:hypothetical protein
MAESNHDFPILKTYFEAATVVKAPATYNSPDRKLDHRFKVVLICAIDTAIEKAIAFPQGIGQF